MIKKIVSLNIWIFTLKMNLINEIFEFSRKKSNWKAFDFSNFGSKTQIFHWFIFSVKIQIFESTIFLIKNRILEQKLGYYPNVLSKTCCASQNLIICVDDVHFGFRKMLLKMAQTSHYIDSSSKKREQQQQKASLLYFMVVLLNAI